MSSFENLVREFIQRDNQIAQAEQSIRELKKNREKLKISIYNQMKNFDSTELDLKENGKIKIFISKTTASLNKDWIYKRCLKLFNDDEEKAEYATNFIYDPKHRPKNERHTIKRLKPRKKKI